MEEIVSAIIMLNESIRRPYLIFIVPAIAKEFVEKIFAPTRK